jgi:hypothetical protein
MKLISGWGCGKIDQPLISGDKIVEFGIAVGWSVLGAIGFVPVLQITVTLFRYCRL